MAVPQRSNPKTGQSTQEIQNQGFDEKYNVPVTELLVENAAGTALDRMLQPAQETGGNLATIADNTSKDGDSFTYYSESLSAVDTITPSTGKAIRIYKVLVTNSSNNSTFRNVTLSSTSLGTFLQGEAIASSWRTTLATDEVLTITPTGGTVYVNIQYRNV